MRLIVMGTGPFAVPSARGLLAGGYDIPLVVTRPLPEPLPKKLPPRPVADWAADNGLPLFEPASINSPKSIEELQRYNADLFFVCDYGQILSKACLAASRLGGINLHGSLLPRHRGAAPVQWSLLSGDSIAGVTVILMTPKLDAGPTLSVRSTPIQAEETSEQLEPRLAALGVDATLEALALLQSWDGVSPIGQIQDSELATKAPRFSKQDGQLDFRQSAETLVRWIRACQPWPGTFAELILAGGKSMRVLFRSARFIAASSPTAEDAIGSVQVLSKQELSAASHQWDWTEDWNTALAIQTGNGLLIANRIQPSGKREMTVAEFLRGHKIDTTTRFDLPSAG